jgi:hypothetical protein
MNKKELIPQLTFWEAVDKIGDHFFTPHQSIYIFSQDKFLYTVGVNKLHQMGKIDEFSIPYGVDSRPFQVYAQESCRAFIRTSRYGSIQIKPITGNLCTMKNVTMVLLYDLDNWPEEDWEDFQVCKLEKFKNNLRTDIFRVERYNG